jgi:hypothetical protein
MGGEQVTEQRRLPPIPHCLLCGLREDVSLRPTCVADAEMWGAKTNVSPRARHLFTTARLGSKRYRKTNEKQGDNNG